MANKYAAVANPSVTPQRVPIPGEENVQVANHAGGYVYSLDKWSRLERFLILGTEGGTYYVNERDHTKQNITSLKECIAEDPAKTAFEIARISESGRAFRNDAAEFALATMVLAGGAARQAAYKHASSVLRTGRTWLEWQSLLSTMGLKWNRSRRNSVADWYTTKTPGDLAYQVIKYQRGGDYTHSDILRLGHPKAGDNQPNAAEINNLFAYLRQNGKHFAAQLPLIVFAWEALKAATSERDVINVIDRNKFVTWEFIPGQWQGSKEVWAALLPNLPYTALMRNLARLTSYGLLNQTTDEANRVIERLTNAEYIKFSRVHPMSILVAQRTYMQGKGDKGKLTWTPNPRITDALEDAFYKAFDTVRPTGKRMLLGIDCSGSMRSPASGLPISCAEAAAVIAMVTMREEPNSMAMRFNNGIEQFEVTPKSRLPEVLKYVQGVNFGGTDCALPMVWANENKYLIDQFVVLTDSETHSGRIHPKQALAMYRKNSSMQHARQVVVGMTSSGFSIADPKDPLTLDVVGIDTSTPSLISRFAEGL